MTSTAYEIVPYRSEWGPQVAGLMVHLWSADVEANLAYLRWKHEGNPYAQDSPGIVALHEGRVVGFRGYSPLPFRIPGGANVVLLCPVDSCVHPDHRMSGLSVRMGQAAMRVYENRYPLFMNWSCTRSSLPGYRRMGFFALAEKGYLTHAGPVGTLCHLMALRELRSLGQSRIRPGRRGDVEVDRAARPAEMAALASREEAAPGTLVLRRDEAFLAWRFANPLGKYIYYYLYRDSLLAGYVAIALSPNNRRGFVLDFAGGETGAPGELMRFILRARHFDVVSVYTFCLTPGQRRALEKLGFGLTGLLSFLETRRTGRIPLFIRPVKEAFGEEDFLVEGVDTRELAAWSLKPLGSDAI